VIVVIQCAGSKRNGAGHIRTTDGRRVLFVAHPKLAAPREGYLFARPDDDSGQGGSWREMLLAYNENASTNPFKLLRAFELYQKNVYRDLTARVGQRNSYVLSAGWGLISAAFLTPVYDITFSASAEGYARRRREDLYRDFRMLPDDAHGPVIFFGSKEYVPLFAALTRSVSSPKTVFYNSSQPPAAPGCLLERFQTRTRTNWQYECAAAFLRGDLLRIDT
jgi:hypothetical protein